METLLEMITSSLDHRLALSGPASRIGLAHLYGEETARWFRILVRGRSAGDGENTTYLSLPNDAVTQVEHLGGDFAPRFDPGPPRSTRKCPVGMVSDDGTVVALMCGTAQGGRGRASGQPGAGNGLTRLIPTGTRRPWDYAENMKNQSKTNITAWTGPD